MNTSTSSLSLSLSSWIMTYAYHMVAVPAPIDREQWHAHASDHCSPLVKP